MSFFNIISRIDPISALTGAAVGATVVGAPLGWYAYKKRGECKALTTSIERAQKAIDAAKQAPAPVAAEVPAQPVQAAAPATTPQAPAPAPAAPQQPANQPQPIALAAQPA